MTKLKEELRAKEAEVAEIKSLMLRKAAEFDNARKRWEREQEELGIRARAEVLHDLVEIWDNFERALEIKADNNNEKTFQAYRRGVELIFSQFRQRLAKYGLMQYSCLGCEFDPAKAEALGYVESSEARPGQIVEELKKGFMLADQVLRPAQVIVAKEVKELKEKKESEASKPDASGESPPQEDASEKSTGYG